MSTSEDEEILLAFCEESRENLDQVDRDLVDLESRGADAELLSRVFRALHTLKGTCGFLGFTRLESLAHAGEDLLSSLREGTTSLDAASTTSLLRLVDAVRTVLTAVEATAQEPADDHQPLVAELRSHLRSASPRPEAPDAVQAVAEPVGPPASAASAETTVRVDVVVLDRLMDLIGELVLARGRIGELAELDVDGPLSAPYRDLRVVSGDLQDTVMTARLQPVGTVTSKFPRIARDLAAALGKQVTVQIEGEGVGVDKAVNEALRDPLLHLVRNALDHGIESPAERLAVGKPAIGTLRIRAFHEGGRVQVEVTDDGRGVDLAALLAKAVSKGVLASDAVLDLTSAQTLDLMFHPGLSTREEVTSTSGRGVGMDVVRTSIEQVGGSVDVSSTPGAGAVFRINVPLTLAVMPVLVTRCGGGRYAIPQAHVQEVTQLGDEQVEAQVDVVGTARMLRLRGRLLPLVELSERLGVAALRADGLVVVVVETDGRRFGVVVDEVAHAVDAVVKPLPVLLRSLTAFAGTTILGDGRPVLVVDVAGIAAAAGITAASAPDTADAAVDQRAPVEAKLLLATATDGGLVAVPVTQVRRLERLAPDRLEWLGGTTVIQYGEELLPVVRVADVLPERRRTDRHRTETAVTDGLQTVVCGTSVGAVGFVVARIDDVIAEPQVVRQPASRPGVAACVVVDGRVAEVLDVDLLAELAGIGRWHDLDRRAG